MSASSFLSAKKKQRKSATCKQKLEWQQPLQEAVPPASWAKTDPFWEKGLK